ncbi:hypothetical protein BZG72_13535 [Salinivibrio sp. PR6]|uniref:Chemotaxis protein n=1 Tax=Salinivibrio siamensis TaxID=414286 RepID=A0ABX3K6D7_9GAMM|nr:MULTISPECIES: hypothetical protein [Salinivibrio]OOE79802.1 hypothetical protein BZG72_13535 [Salinivibrio sp. PR6]OOE82551.1 hypothetical protein BZG73_12870 [Salinivibrio siamensis]
MNRSKVIIVLSLVISLTGSGYALFKKRTEINEINSMVAALTNASSGLDPLDSVASMSHLKFSTDAYNTIIEQLEEGINKAESQGNSQALIRAKLSALEERIEEVDARNIGIRQSINPMNPDEILKISRLKDEIERISRAQIQLQESLTNERKRIKSNVAKEIDVLKSTLDFYGNLILALLPVISTLAYYAISKSKH